MTLLDNDPLTQISFSLHENKGVFALLLGSGLSRSSSIPTGWEITLDLIRRVALAQGIEDRPDWEEWYRETTGVEPNYSQLLEQIGLSPAERRSVLHSYIEPSEVDREEGRKLTTEAHKAIAQLVQTGHIRVIITTNFDRLMENALREIGIEPTAIASVDALSGAEPLTHSKCYLVKLHGDYKDARILNTDEELSEYPDQYNSLLDRIFDEHGLIVCGWSGEWDHALRAALLRAPNRRYPIAWSVRGKLGDGADELVRVRGARVVQIESADNFFGTIQQRVETLDQGRLQNPNNIDLLVADVKRYVAKAEYRIRLEDTFSNEIARLLAELNALDFNSDSQWDKNEFVRRVDLYESVTERLARICGLLGRWGDGAELGFFIDGLRALFQHSETKKSGVVAYIGLRSYPCVLALTSYALGLTKSKRWSDLYSVLASSIDYDQEGAHTIVEKLFLWSWQGGQDDFWKLLPGMENRHAPLSDHLVVVMNEWKSTFAGVEPDIDLLYERFETLASLVYFEKYSEAEMEIASKSPRNGQPLGWIPIGRVGYRHGDRKRLIEELQHDGTVKALLNAGFAKKSQRFLDLFIINLNIISGLMRWY